jgi:hypothetical protein
VTKDELLASKDSKNEEEVVLELQRLQEELLQKKEQETIEICKKYNKSEVEEDMEENEPEVPLKKKNRATVTDQKEVATKYGFTD